MFDRLAGCGATPGGGVERQCATAADGAARDVFEAALKSAGAETRTDVIGNQFGVFRLAGCEDAPLVMIGSHLDSQPKGGRFDGALGVAAAVCVGEALSATDDAGVTLAEALNAIGRHGTDRPPSLPACYLELHVEQGVSLETAGATIGVVTRNWGATKFDVVFQGEQAHTGPCPMPLRRDALLAASYLIVDARAIADRWPGVVHTSVGRLVVSPNSANVVPSETQLSLEIRSNDDGVLAQASALADQAIAKAAARANVTVAAVTRTERAIRTLPASVCDLVEDCSAAAGCKSLRLDTVAGHDAISLLGHCPTGLVFVPSVGGVAHNEGELTSKADVEAGFRVCLEAASRLCRSGGSPERALRLAREVAA
ncbi:Zn-dependent hydrolase [Hansschlegelia plantiphila]|uniref:Zn-dependent hydrolase n=1 Tax=Hansschlegelia plantiphila TaxID=374655 RepID=A0A9W6MWN4_9HYPH|nr:Zn-dependent hydrolase [Hansschlegelia plantiphila]